MLLSKKVRKVIKTMPQYIKDSFNRIHLVHCTERLNYFKGLDKSNNWTFRRFDEVADNLINYFEGLHHHEYK